MKRQILYIACFVVGIFSGCRSQDERTQNTNKFVKQLEMEIGDEGFNKALFSDTIIFVIDEKVQLIFQEKTVMKKWNKVETIFRNTDYIINSFDDVSEKMPIGQKKFGDYYRLENHRNLYVLGLNRDGKIGLVQEIQIKLPPNAPPH